MNVRRISDPDVQLLAAIAGTLHSDYVADDMSWEGSPFAWIRQRPSRQRGSIAEKLVAGFLAAKDFDVVRSPDSEADRVIDGLRTEIKSSTLWKNGSYRFQQLRDQNYDVAICLGVSPFNAHCWVIPKSDIMKNWGTAEGLSSQHGGQAGTDTAWLVPNQSRPSRWTSGGLEPCRCLCPVRDAAPTIFCSDRLAADAGPGRRRSPLIQIRPDALEAPDFVGIGENPARQDGQRGRRSGGGGVLGYRASWHDRGPGGRHDGGARSR